MNCGNANSMAKCELCGFGSEQKQFMYCADLTPYHYEIPTGLPGTRNVGWLDGGASFETGDVPSNVLALVSKVAETPIAIMRGQHYCHLCQAPGTGELWFQGVQGPVYTAPTLLSHYMRAHRYCPPEEFLEIFDGPVKALSEPEREQRLIEHERKLAQNPSRADLLIDYFEIKIFWPIELFSDLLAFEKYFNQLQDENFRFSSNQFRRDRKSYSIESETRDPQLLFEQISSRCIDGLARPTKYQYRLVLLNETWTVVEI